MIRSIICQCHYLNLNRGIYQCVASNEAATITVDSELLIENVAPRPPYNLTANSTDTSITLHWEPGLLILNDYKCIV